MSMRWAPRRRLGSQVTKIMPIASAGASLNSFSVALWYTFPSHFRVSICPPAQPQGGRRCNHRSQGHAPHLVGRKGDGITYTGSERISLPESSVYLNAREVQCQECVSSTAPPLSFHPPLHVTTKLSVEELVSGPYPVRSRTSYVSAHDYQLTC
ncbi:hypothetical protein L226DRAFT_203239 [Lentinus tigrinus ALCF2SS1-7]|uniref:uncharacterized protein n=1 Tax=Lentinus tigrinus ALCF2SS1-7 TaxID=1328758 RepID=UPI001165FF1D|nr:hypothetical protein L226DRAFT_203239 [Lentinus tigrinus ALCF2SS1-7]